MTALRWLFTDRTTGRVVVAQWPNAPLWVFLAASLLRRTTSGHDDLLGGIGTAALAVWAVLELAKGDSPFRRLLGAGVLVLLLVRLL